MEKSKAEQELERFRESVEILEGKLRKVKEA